MLTTRRLSQQILNEEKEELNVLIIYILSIKEQLTKKDIEIINIIPVIKGLKVIYKTSKSDIKTWARTIRYKELSDRV